MKAQTSKGLEMLGLGFAEFKGVLASLCSFPRLIGLGLDAVRFCRNAHAHIVAGSVLGTHPAELTSGSPESGCFILPAQGWWIPNRLQFMGVMDKGITLTTCIIPVQG